MAFSREGGVAHSKGGAASPITLLEYRWSMYSPDAESDSVDSCTLTPDSDISMLTSSNEAQVSSGTEETSTKSGVGPGVTGLAESVICMAGTMIWMEGILDGIMGLATSRESMETLLE